MTHISRIEQPAVPRDDILLNRPALKEHNISPELPPSQSLHRNPLRTRIPGNDHLVCGTLRRSP